MPIHYIGIIIGVTFCLISAAFDVYVAYITQSFNTMTLVFYCFISSSSVFFIISWRKGLSELIGKIQSDAWLVLMVNISVLLNWGGLFYSLRYLEPAVVGVVSVACGPALTIVLSSYILSHWLKDNTPAARAEKVVSYLVLIAVFIMLINSFTGSSGLTSTSPTQRIVGIISVILCALGTVLYTIVSKIMFQRGWQTYEILAVRNILILLASFVYLSSDKQLFLVNDNYIIPLIILVLIGHILPIYLIQKTIFYLTALRVSLVLLTLPIFTLILQYFDERISVSISSIVSLSFILILLLYLSIFKLKTAK
ncbi:EamA family transporter [Yersinia ruckeri]|nr:EamA family transporter [Yersinia ruckeri]MCW6526524.1 EamA family transporter [Yersinia ruckeri]MCW6561792.1 EamA family transporter [Yersinia ruckeri]UZY05000.1 EamA family transporter [Yersinia ruckeri]